jgi:hypothetical protein
MKSKTVRSDRGYFLLGVSLSTNCFGTLRVLRNGVVPQNPGGMTGLVVTIKAVW